MSETRVTHAEVERIAELARLELDAEERERMSVELGRILAYVRTLEAVDTSGVAPLAHVGRTALETRPDALEASFTQAEALAEAPHASGGGFAVPAFVDEG